MAEIRIGISGWTYPPWRGVFYPEKLRQKDELTFASSRFSTIEVNGTFHGTRRPADFLKWFEATPEAFVFSVKAPRFITHMRRLREAETPLANFFASGVLRLGRKFGPILWQLPPSLRFDEALLANFLALLPHDTDAAVLLAKRHDSRIGKSAWTETDAKRPIRHAIEIRHESFRDERFIKLLRRHKIALVCADTVEWPRLMDVTSDFIYCRLHGSEEIYASGYDDAALRVWEQRIRRWVKGGEPEDAERVAGAARRSRSGRDVFVYFDNDLKVRAPADAAVLASRLRL